MVRVEDLLIMIAIHLKEVHSDHFGIILILEYLKVVRPSIRLLLQILHMQKNGKQNFDI